MQLIRQLVAATVRENLTLFDATVTDDRILAILADLGLEGWLARLPIEGHRLRRQVAAVSLGRFQPAATRAFLKFLLERREELQAMAEGHPSS